MKTFISKVCEALEEFQKYNFVYANLRPENILLNLNS